MGKVFKKFTLLGQLTGGLFGGGEKEKSPNLQQTVAPAKAEAKVLPEQEKVTPGATQDEIQAAVDAERKRRAALNQYQPEDEELGLMTGKKTILGG